MKMKNAAATILAGVMAVSLAGCGQTAQTTQTQEQAVEQSQEQAEENPLLSLEVSTHDWVNRATKSLDGTYATAWCDDKSLFEDATAEQFTEFVDEKMPNKKDADYFTVEFPDGTGLEFYGCSKDSCDYANVDEQGMIDSDYSITYERTKKGKWKASDDDQPFAFAE